MRKSLIASLGILLAVSTSAFADNLKIGIVDVRLALQKSPQMASASAQVEKQFKPRQQEIIDAQKDVQTDINKLNKEGAVMKNEERTALQDKIVSKRTKLQTSVTSFRQDLETTQNQTMQKIFGKMGDVIRKIAAKGGYDLILQKEAAPYFKDSFDLTNQVIQAMSKE